MTVRKLIAELCRNCNSIDDDAVVRIITRGEENVSVRLQTATVRFVSFAASIGIEASELKDERP